VGIAVAGLFFLRKLCKLHTVLNLCQFSGILQKMERLNINILKGTKLNPLIVSMFHSVPGVPREKMERLPSQQKVNGPLFKHSENRNA